MSLTKRAKGCLAFTWLKTSRSLLLVEYLYQQTGRALEDICLDPDTPDKVAAVQDVEDVKGSRKMWRTPPSSSQALHVPAVRKKHSELTWVWLPPAKKRPLGFRLLLPRTPPRSLRQVYSRAADDDNDDDDNAANNAHLHYLSSSSCYSSGRDPDGELGYQHFLKLARALLEARSFQTGFSDRRVAQLIVLWNCLPEHDRRRVIYPPRHQEWQSKGRFKVAKGKVSSCPGKESLQW